MLTRARRILSWRRAFSERSAARWTRRGAGPAWWAAVAAGLAGAAAAVHAAGCAEAEPASQAAAGPGAGGSGDGGAGAGAGASGDGGNIFDGGFEEVAPPPPPVLYAHDGATLYRADPSISPLSLELIGAFDCVGGAGQDGSMTDVAVNSAGEIWGVSVNHVHRLVVQGSVVHCAASVALANPSSIKFYGLAFAPQGVLDPDEEVLVAGNTAGELWSIDGAGNLQQRGSFGNVLANDGHGHLYANAGKKWELSGDIAFAANNGQPVGFATVRDCPNPPSPSDCNPVDTLIEIDVGAMATATIGPVTKSVRGQVVKRAGCTDGVAGDYGNMYGIAIFEDRVFGFSRFPGDSSGYAVDMSNADGTACRLQDFPETAWYGAGITTLVPVEPPAELITAAAPRPPRPPPEPRSP